MIELLKKRGILVLSLLIVGLLGGCSKEQIDGRYISTGGGDGKQFFKTIIDIRSDGTVEIEASTNIEDDVADDSPFKKDARKAVADALKQTFSMSGKWERSGQTLTFRGKNSAGKDTTRTYSIEPNGDLLSKDSEKVGRWVKQK